MSAIRIHLGPMPRMLRAMINDLLNVEPDMTVVGNSFSDETSLSEASAEHADILIAQASAAVPATCTAAVLSGSPTAILAVEADGNNGTGVKLVRRPISLSGGGSSLAEAVRSLLAQTTSLELTHPNSLEG